MDIDVSRDFNLDMDAQRACRPEYNEVCRGIVPCGADDMLVIFHACRGLETSRGVRSVALTRSMIDACTDVWHVARVDVTRTPDATITSRRGLSHVTV